MDLLATVFKAVLERTGVEPQAIGDIVIGSVLGPSSQRANECRIASFFAGIPETVPVRTVNRYDSRDCTRQVRLPPQTLSSKSEQDLKEAVQMVGAYPFCYTRFHLNRVSLSPAASVTAGSAIATSNLHNYCNLHGHAKLNHVYAVLLFHAGNVPLACRPLPT